MQRTNWVSGTARPSKAVRLIVVIILFILVTGLWVCLWVPPSPAF